MNSHKLTNLADCTAGKDAANKSHVDSKAKQPSPKFQKLSTTDGSTYSLSDYDVIPTNFSESDFDSIPSGFYGCYTDYLPSPRFGILPTSRKSYLISITYQQPADRNKYYEWIDSTNGDEYTSSYFQVSWVTWSKYVHQPTSVELIPSANSTTTLQSSNSILCSVSGASNQTIVFSDASKLSIGARAFVRNNAATCDYSIKQWHNTIIIEILRDCDLRIS
jgi:hypothetical protein